MPFTPYHMGPGLLIKSALRPKFSLLIFGWAQFVTDFEVLIAILSRSGQLHGYTHTFLGGTLIALVCALTGKYALDALSHFDASFSMLRVSWPVALGSAFVGTYSHVLLDGLMHSDVTPFAPVTFTNPLLGLVSWVGVQKLCVFSGVIGALIYAAKLGLSWVSRE